MVALWNDSMRIEIERCSMFHCQCVEHRSKLAQFLEELLEEFPEEHPGVPGGTPRRILKGTPARSSGGNFRNL